MIRHPGGKDMTDSLLSLSKLSPGAKILIMGAGDGESVSLLSSYGYIACGVDLKPGDNVISGDMCALPYPRQSFDGVMAECAFSVCGSTAAAFSEARRVLKPNGVLILSDVYFKADVSPSLSLSAAATKGGWISEAVGFELQDFIDCTEIWTDYIIDCVWHGKDLGDCGFFKSAAKAKCGYFISSWKKVRY